MLVYSPKTADAVPQATRSAKVASAVRISHLADLLADPDAKSTSPLAFFDACVIAGVVHGFDAVCMERFGEPAAEKFVLALCDSGTGVMLPVSVNADSKPARTIYAPRHERTCTKFRSVLDGVCGVSDEMLRRWNIPLFQFPKDQPEYRSTVFVAFERVDWEWLRDRIENDGSDVAMRFAKKLHHIGMSDRYDVITPVKKAMVRIWTMPDKTISEVCLECGQPAHKTCTACMRGRYCSVECQKKNRAAHRGECSMYKTMAAHLGVFKKVDPVAADEIMPAGWRTALRCRPFPPRV